MANTVTSKEIRYIQQRYRSSTMEAIAVSLGGRHTAEQLTAAFDQYRRRLKERKAAQYVSPHLNGTLFPVDGNHVTVPESAQADRERRYALHPRDLTAALVGDPLPGYSALDRRHAQS